MPRHKLVSVKVEKRISSEDDEERQCRTCLGEGSISINEYKVNDIYQWVKTLTNIEIDENDPYTKFLCHSCFSFIFKAMKFRDTAQKCQKILEEEHSVLKMTVPGSPPENDSDNYLAFDLKPDPDSAHENEKKYSTELRDNIKRKCKNYSKKKNEKIECEVCKKQVNKYYYKGHMKLHADASDKTKKTEECKICNKTLEKGYFKKHMTTMHGEGNPKLVCYMCGRTFRFESGYRSHIASHKDEFPFKCQHCPYKGKHSGLLRVHMRTHTKDYKYNCTECTAVFLTNSNLHRHLLTHKAKEFKCDKCTREFHKAIDLEKHVKADHMGIKPHICKFCDKAFGYRSAMMKHQLHMHKRQKLSNGRMPDYLISERSKLENTSNS